jgi:hypothetical protein
MIKYSHILNRPLFRSFKNDMIYDFHTYKIDKKTWKESIEYNWTSLDMLQALLFFSVDESEIIEDKIIYDVIQNRWQWSKWYDEQIKNNNFNYNLNNYIWRKILNYEYSWWSIFYIINCYNKINKINKQKKEILDLLNKNLWKKY